MTATLHNPPALPPPGRPGQASDAGPAVLVLPGPDAAPAGRYVGRLGAKVTLPQGGMGVKPTSRLMLNIDTRWVDSNGYRPVRVEAVNLLPGPWPTPGATTADRTFRIVLQPRAWMWGGGMQRVTFFLEIPQGKTREQTTVAVPQNIGWGSFAIEVYEDGELLEDMSSKAVGIPTRNTRQSTEAAPAILIIDADAPGLDARESRIATGGPSPGPTPPGGQPTPQLPDIRFLNGMFPDPSQGVPTVPLPTPGGLMFQQTENGEGLNVVPSAKVEPADELTNLRWVQDLPRVEMLPFTELPSRWLDYTCLDMIFISLGDLRTLVRQHPERWQAIRQWLLTGPTLVVYDMPLDAPRLAELDELLRLPASPLRSSAGAASTAWNKPTARTADATIRGLQPGGQPVKLGKPQPPGQSLPPPPGQPPFLLRSAGLGRVVAMPTDQPLLQGGVHGTSWLFNEVDSQNWAWYQRHGLSLSRDNRDFWNMMIPGVGRAPVTAYLVLISLFVLVIGPVNYFLLQRRRRLYLLLVTVPAGAGLVALVLLNYALLSDGLGVRVRARSVTLIDQREGQAVSWSRQCYYAGLAPRRACTFPRTRPSTRSCRSRSAGRGGGRATASICGGTRISIWPPAT